MSETPSAESHFFTSSDIASEAYEQTNPPSVDVLHGLIYEYLIFNCYNETASVFGNSCQISEKKSRIWSKSGGQRLTGTTMDVDQPANDTDMDIDTTHTNAPHSGTALGGLGGADVLEAALSTIETRKMLTGLILNGKVGDAIQICQCQQFIELIRSSAPEALSYAQEELGKYAFMSDKSYERILQDVIGLLAYTDPFDSPLASFMSQARRIEVADKLNSHILAHHGHLSQSALARIVKQATILRDYLHTDSSKDKKGSNNKIVYPKWKLSSFLDG